MRHANDNEPVRYGPWPTTKKIAKDLGSRFFFDHTVCKNGHLSERYTCDGKCVICKLSYRREIYYANPEKAKSDARNAHHRDREHNLSRMKKYAENNKEKLSATRKAYREKNRDRRVAQSREWYSENHSHARNYQKERREIYSTHARNRRAKLNGNGGEHTANDVIRILKDQNYKCAECGTSVRQHENRHVDHILPIKLGGSNAPCNIQILCPPCNLSKGAKHPIEFAKIKGRLL